MDKPRTSNTGTILAFAAEVSLLLAVSACGVKSTTVAGGGKVAQCPVAQARPLTAETLIHTSATQISEPAVCLTGGNILALSGDASDFIFKGHTVITNGEFGATAADRRDLLHVRVRPVRSDQGSHWLMTISSRSLGQLLQVQDYPYAERALFEPYRTAGFSFEGNGRGCNRSISRFKIYASKWVGRNLAELTATFAQQCENSTKALTGCIHFENRMLIEAERALPNSKPTRTQMPKAL
jgi:hypothetical protein